MNNKNNKEVNSKTALAKLNFKMKVFFLGIFHLFIILLFVFMLVVIWPVYKEANGKLILEDTVSFFGWVLTIGSEIRFLLIVIVAAVLGSFIHAATSFTSYVGNKSLVMSWAWWYYMRPFIGIALSLIFYFVIRGGLLSAGTDAEEISVYGIAAVAGLVGMFSKQATDKLQEVFVTLFRTKEGAGDDLRADKLGEKILVSDKMIPINKITAYVIHEDKKLSDIKISELYNLLSETVTRIPVLDSNGVLKYVIHQSIIYKFIFKKSREASQKKEPFDLDSLTLENFLDYPGIKEIVEDAISFLNKDANILNAKEAIEKIKNCQDVFITETGKREEKILGWLTNVDIGKYLSA
ncbi:MAG: hypothetical protein ACM34J_08695 [Ignavibacteria bacterium]